MTNICDAIWENPSGVLACTFSVKSKNRLNDSSLSNLGFQ